MRRPDLVIFDCDGVLVDSEPLSTAVLAAALSAVGLPTSPDQAHDASGMLLADIAERVGDRLGSSLPTGFWERFEHDRALAFESSLRPVPGAGEAVRAVKAAGTASRPFLGRAERHAVADHLIITPGGEPRADQQPPSIPDPAHEVRLAVRGRAGDPHRSL